MAWDEELVSPASRRVAEGAFDEPSVLWRDIQCGWRNVPDRTSQAQPGEVFHAVERREAFASRTSGGRLRRLRAFPFLDDLSLKFDGWRLEPRWRDMRRGAGRFWGAFATEHALQERSRLDQLAGASQSGGLANCVMIEHLITLFCRREGRCPGEGHTAPPPPSAGQCGGGQD